MQNPKNIKNAANSVDLRGLLLQLYLKNNPQAEHLAYIYSYHGVVDIHTNPFYFVSGKIPTNVKQSIVLQNLPTGEMIQAFLVPVKSDRGRPVLQLENIAIYGNKSGTLMHFAFDNEKFTQNEKYRQFLQLAKACMQQFV
ncbi:hypothetical protein ACKLNO_06575 [Neisseriaceae bacterium B1]